MFCSLSVLSWVILARWKKSPMAFHGEPFTWVRGRKGQLCVLAQSAGSWGLLRERFSMWRGMLQQNAHLKEHCRKLPVVGVGSFTQWTLDEELPCAKFYCRHWRMKADGSGVGVEMHVKRNEAYGWDTGQLTQKVSVCSSTFPCKDEQTRNCETFR